MQLRRDLQDACALRAPQEASLTGGSFAEASAPEAPSDMDAGALCLLHQSSVSTPDSYRRVLQYDMTTTGDGGVLSAGRRVPRRIEKVEHLGSSESREGAANPEGRGGSDALQGGKRTLRGREPHNLSSGMPGRLAAVPLLSATTE
jgi:hypothetical protein